MTRKKRYSKSRQRNLTSALSAFFMMLAGLAQVIRGLLTIFLGLYYELFPDARENHRVQSVAYSGNGEQGWIYILINPSLQKNYLKIGSTNRSPQIRAKEVSKGTGIPTEFVVAFEMPVNDCRYAEKLVHEYFRNLRITKNREFFVIDLKDAIPIVTKIANNVNAYLAKQEQAKQLELGYSSENGFSQSSIKRDIETPRLGQILIGMALIILVFACIFTLRM